MYVCMHACMYVCIYVYIYMHIYMYIYMYICIYIYIYVYIYMYIYMKIICVFIYFYTCIFIHFLGIYIYIFIHICIHTHSCARGRSIFFLQWHIVRVILGNMFILFFDSTLWIEHCMCVFQLSEGKKCRVLEMRNATTWKKWHQISHVVLIWNSGDLQE